MPWNTIPEIREEVRLNSESRIELVDHVNANLEICIDSMDGNRFHDSCFAHWHYTNGFGETLIRRIKNLIRNNVIVSGNDQDQSTT